MKRIIGLMMFCFGVGMTVMLIVPETFTTLVFITACLIVGYNLFCC